MDETGSINQIQPLVYITEVARVERRALSLYMVRLAGTRLGFDPKIFIYERSQKDSDARNGEAVSTGKTPSARRGAKVFGDVQNWYDNEN